MIPQIDKDPVHRTTRFRDAAATGGQDEQRLLADVCREAQDLGGLGRRRDRAARLLGEGDGALHARHVAVGVGEVFDADADVTALLEREHATGVSVMSPPSTVTAQGRSASPSMARYSASASGIGGAENVG